MATTLNISFDEEKLTVSDLERRLITAVANLRYETALVAFMIKGRGALGEAALHNQAEEATNVWLEQLLGPVGLKLRFADD